jgi:hypothetical protein
MVQSGFFTGTIIYFSLWYCKREQIMRFAILFGAVFAAGVLDGILVRNCGPHKKISHFELIESTIVINLGLWYQTYGRYPWSVGLAVVVFN